MQSRLMNYNEIVSVVMHFLAAITFFLVVQIVIAGELSSLYVHMLFVMCFMAVIGIRLFINGNFLIYMIAHFTLYLTLFTIPLQSVMFIVFAVYLVALTVWSVSYWKGNELADNGRVPWATIILFAISYIYSFVSHHEVLRNYLLVTGCVYMLLFLLRFYIKGLYDLANNQLLHKQLPLSQIAKSNSYLVGMLFVVITFAMLLAAAIKMDDLLYVIGDALIVVLRILIKGFFIILAWIADMLKNMGFDDIGSLWDALGKAVMEENAGSKLIRMILAFIKIAITVLFLIWVGRGMNIKLRQFLNDNTLPTDRVERIRVREKGLQMLTDRIVRKRTSEPRSPIRRSYIKAVRHFGKRLVLNKSVTTGQIEEQLTFEEAEKMRPLKEAYEQERYKDEVE